MKNKPPWQATGSVSIFGKKIDMSPDTRKPGCPVEGGLGFAEDGKLDHAGAVLDGLQIPIPSPPGPPFAALGSPALDFRPGTRNRPLILIGCLTLRDYPEGNAFEVVGCASFLSAGSGVSVPNTEVLPFCPKLGQGNDQRGIRALRARRPQLDA